MTLREGARELSTAGKITAEYVALSEGIEDSSHIFLGSFFPE